MAAGLAVHDFAHHEPADARLLASLRCEDLVATVTNGTLVTELEAINEPLRVGMAALARRLFGRATRASIEWTACAVVDFPQGAIRRHLVAGTPILTTVRSQLRQAIRAALLTARVESGDAEDERP